MSHKFKQPKPLKGTAKQIPFPAFRTGPPLANTEKAHKVIGKLATEGNFQNSPESRE